MKDAFAEITRKQILHNQKKSIALQSLYTPLDVTRFTSHDVFVPSLTSVHRSSTYGTGKKVFVIREGAIGKEISF